MSKHHPKHHDPEDLGHAILADLKPIPREIRTDIKRRCVSCGERWRLIAHEQGTQTIEDIDKMRCPACHGTLRPLTPSERAKVEAIVAELTTPYDPSFISPKEATWLDDLRADFFPWMERSRWADLVNTESFRDDGLPDIPEIHTMPDERVDAYMARIDDRFLKVTGSGMYGSEA